MGSWPAMAAMSDFYQIRTTRFRGCPIGREFEFSQNSEAKRAQPM